MPGAPDPRKEQLEWLERHPVPDKDRQPMDGAGHPNPPEPGHSPAAPSRKGSRSAKRAHRRRWITERVVDEELDLHGYDVAQAMAEVEVRMEALVRSGHRTLRVVHGGGNRPGTIRHRLMLNCRSLWRGRLERLIKEPHNAGATILVLKRP